MFQPKQWARRSRENGDQLKTGPNPNLGLIERQNRPLFEVPMCINGKFRLRPIENRRRFRRQRVVIENAPDDYILQ